MTPVLAKAAVTVSSGKFVEMYSDHAFRTRPFHVVEAIGSQLSKPPDIDGMATDLALEDEIRFEHLAGLFSSNSLNHAVIGLTIRMAAYIFGVARELDAKRAIDIGRFKGGSAILMAAAMGQGHEVWSIVNWEKEERLTFAKRSYDDQLADFYPRWRLNINMINGDSRTVSLDPDADEVDIVLIDGGHTAEIVRSDFERFGRRVRVGGAVFLDDCSGEGTFAPRPEYMIPLLDEFVADGSFGLVQTVDRLGHLQRIR